MSKSFGGTINSKGYKVLNPQVGVLWGDGLDYNKILEILKVMDEGGWSAENIVFGMGGGLLQKVNRDTQRFVFKSSAQCRNGVWHDVYKSPTDKTKVSKRGRLKLVDTCFTGNYKTVGIDECPEREDILQCVFEDGELKKEYSFDDVRKNSEILLNI